MSGPTHPAPSAPAAPASAPLAPAVGGPTPQDSLGVLRNLWAGAGNDGGDTPSPVRRRVIRGAVIVLVVLAVGVLLVWSRPTGVSDAAYHPENPSFRGSRAVARVLDGNGVRVVVAEGEQELRSAGIDGDTTIVVSNSADLREATTRNLEQLARSAERLVLVNPERAVVRALVPAVTMRVQGRTDIVNGCDTADARPSERLGRSLTEYRLTGATRCYATSDDYAVYLRTSTAQLREVVLVGSTDIISNDRVAEADNAALALRVLGHSGKLVWYVPDLRDLPIATTPSSRRDSIYPPWWSSAVLLLGCTVGALMWWRGRRFGRLVPEPLPVVIRATETTESRGRMYRKARDSARASSVLREATVRRLTAYLGLGSGSDPQALATAVAANTGRSLDEVHWLLHGAPVDTDPALLELANDLARLEKEIRRS